MCVLCVYVCMVFKGLVLNVCMVGLVLVVCIVCMVGLIPVVCSVCVCVYGGTGSGCVYCVCVCVYGRTGSGCVYGWKGENWFTLLDQYIVNIDWIDPESADSPTTCLRTPPPPPNSGHLLPSPPPTHCPP